MKNNEKRFVNAHLILGDIHCPRHSQRAFSLLFKILDNFAFVGVGSIGDMSDFGSTSRHSPSGRQRLYTVGAEIDATLALAKSIRDACPEFTENWITLGNHDEWLRRWLVRHPEVANDPHFRYAERLREIGWRTTPYQQSKHLTEHLVATHDFGLAGKTAFTRGTDVMGTSVVFGHCLPRDYEVMTTSGWVSLDEITDRHTAYCYHRGRIVTSAISEVVKYDYTGELIRLRHGKTDQWMTDKHHVYTKDDRYVPIREAMETLRPEDLIQTAEPYAARKDYPVSDALLKLVVAFCADGSWDGGVVRFSFKKQRKIERVNELLAELGVEARWSETTPGVFRLVKCCRAVADLLEKYVTDKLLPNWLVMLSARQRQIVIDELPLWDGSTLNGGSSFQYCSSRAEDVGLVQQLLAQHGVLSTNPRADTVCWGPAKPCCSRRKLKEYTEMKMVENLPVGCITTEHQNFVVRSPEGRVQISSNTHKAGIWWTGSVLGPIHVSMNVGWLGDPEQIDYAHVQKVKAENVHGVGLVHMGPGDSFSVEFSPFFEYDGKLCCRVLDQWVAVPTDQLDERADVTHLLRLQTMDVTEA